MPQGRLRYYVLAGPLQDQHTTSTDLSVQTFIRDSVTVIGTYTPFFDLFLLWMPSAHVYFDSYAIYNPSALATQHPEWIMKDVSGNQLFIPWGCANGTCPQYAGDFANPAFVAYQISQIRQYLFPAAAVAGFRGLWLDDVNLSMRASDASGNEVAPVDPATRAPMTAGAWAWYFQAYMTAIRAALPPSIAVLHNSIWFTPDSSFVHAEIGAADYINLERGFSDPGITGGTGQFSLSALMKFIDLVHSLGASVVIDEYFVANLNYAVAGYFLTNNGNDMIGFADLPLIQAGWPRILSANLGAANWGSRSQPQPGLWTRHFTGGDVYLNEPGNLPVTFSLLAPVMYDSDGVAHSSPVTLNPQTGVTLFYKKP